MRDKSAKTDDVRKEIKRIKRVSDQLCTMHSVLRDRYNRRAFLLDISMILSSIWLNAMVFVEPTIGIKLSPFNIDKTIWIGLLAILTFALAMFQFRAKWKERKVAHQKASEFYASVKLDCGNTLTEDDEDIVPISSKIIDKYHTASKILIQIPESQFLYLKKKHKLKVFLSRFLDKHPSSSLFYLRLRLWWRDNHADLPKISNNGR